MNRTIKDAPRAFAALGSEVELVVPKSQYSYIVFDTPPNLDTRPAWSPCSRQT